MNKFSSLDYHYKLYWLLLYVRRAIYKARVKELSQYKITAEEVKVLFTIDMIGYSATPTAISRVLLREPHSISGMLNRMERQELIGKVRDLERKNLVRVYLTQKGQQAYAQSSKRESIHRIMSTLSEEECEQLRECLEKLLDKALEELGVSRQILFPLF